MKLYHIPVIVSLLMISIGHAASSSSLTDFTIEYYDKGTKEKLAKKFWKENDNLFAEVCDGDSRIIAYNKKGKPRAVAGAILSFNLDLLKCEILYMVVDPEFQHRGIGSAMILMIEEIALEKKCPTLTLYSIPEAKSFYKQREFREESECFFTKQLTEKGTLTTT